VTLKELENTRDSIRNIKMTNTDPEEIKIKTLNITGNLAKTLENNKPTQKIVDLNVEYFKHISKFGKSIGKYLNPQIEDSSYGVKFSNEILNKLIADHLYKNGLGEVADKFCLESKTIYPSEERKKYSELCEIRKELRMRVLDKTMAWAKENNSLLLKNNSDIPFTIHKLQVFLLRETGK